MTSDRHRGLRRVGEAETAYVADLLALAFYSDPTWSWAFPDEARRLEQHRALWTLFLTSAVPYGWVWMTEDGGAAALWVPPGQAELTEEAEAQIPPMLHEQLGAHANDVLALMDSFEANHPGHTPHYYLSLLATHPDHRGQGKGMGLLAANLHELDALQMPAYLESSNRANDRRYERLGFRQVGEFAAPPGKPTLACMWRDPR
jgi:GNAT superfamily N-acetyltransferase